MEVCKAAKAAGSFIHGEVSKLKTEDIESKGVHNYVTYVDKAAEKQLVEILQHLLPEAGFIVEENTISRQGDRYRWVVDPLDGTTNFIHSLPCFSVSIALMDQDQVIVGVVYEINQDECFYAWKDGGCYLNGQPVKVSKATSLDQSLLATGFPYFDYSLLDKYMELFTWCLRNTHGVRRMGSAAVDLAYTACGRFEGFFEYSLSPWDVAAGSLLVTEAGGKVTDFQGEQNHIFGKQILACSTGIYDQLAPRIRKVFYDQQ
ncbi:MAG: inositol monophosphatase family protein [Bacteroidales bacterium]